MAGHRRSVHDTASAYAYNRGMESTAANTEIEVAVLGAPFVGKTAIVSQFLHSKFPETYVPTVDDMSWVEYETGSGGQLMLKIIDSAGSHEFAAMRSLYIASAEAFLLVCSAVDPSSIDEIMNIVSEIESKNTKNPSISIIANKIDKVENLEDSLETLNTVADFSSSKGVRHHAISAKDHEMVTQVFKACFSSLQASQEFAQLKKRRQSLPHEAGLPNISAPEDRSHSCIVS